MERHGDEVHIETDEARGGSTPHIVRWVLGISLFAAIVVMSLVWIIPALMQSDAEEQPNASEIGAPADSGDSTDSIVSDGADELETLPQDSGGVGVIENRTSDSTVE